MLNASIKNLKLQYLQWNLSYRKCFNVTFILINLCMFLVCLIMKNTPFKFILFLFCFLSVHLILSGQNTSKNEKKPDSVTFDYLLKKPGLEEWNKAVDSWKSKDMFACYEKSGIKIECSGCTNATMTVDFYIGKSGKIEKYNVIKENFCGDKSNEKLKQCFIKYFLTVVFTESLRNKTIRATLGRSLKC
jgi:hypothetical protein